MGNRSPVDLWSLLHRLPLYSSIHVPSRFLAAAVLALAFAAGHGLSWLVGFLNRIERPQLARTLTGLIVGVVCVELAMTGWQLFADIFVCDPNNPRMIGLRVAPHQKFATRFTAVLHYYPVMTSCLYPRLMSNTGVLHGYENIAVPRGDVRVFGDPQYRGEAYLENAQDSHSQVTMLDWTMSRVMLGVHIAMPDRLVLNQNYATGWRAIIQSHGGTRAEDVKPNSGGLVSIEIRPGDTRVKFFYWPRSLVWGAWISGITICGCGGALRYWRRRAQNHGCH